MEHIAIIGGGFSGSMTAVNLFRRSACPLKITLINSGYPLGRGIAYSTRNGNHLLNVAARNMSALADQPDHFAEWLHTRSEYYLEPMPRLRERFVPRRVYGDYLHGLLFSHTRYAANRGCAFEAIADEAVDIAPVDGGLRITLASGKTIDATRVVLATGNSAPSGLRLKGLDPAHPKYFQNPWVDWESTLTDKSENVILIGTGLTAIDVLISLTDLGWKGKIFAVSRNGLLPLSHFKGVEYPSWLDPKAGKITLAQAIKAFKEHFHKTTASGVNPAILVDKLRPVTQQLWQGFSLAEKKRFNRHFRTRWNVVRHRIAQSIHQLLLEAIAARKLEIVKGSLRELTEIGGQFVLTVKSGDKLRKIEGGALINCTGPSESYTRSAVPLYARLLERGLIQADDMDMGIQATPDFAVIQKNGTVSKSIFALGPALKGTLWESVAVPELRSQTFRLAEMLASQLPGKPQEELKESVQVVNEYEI